jgi:hypothetical protein
MSFIEIAKAMYSKEKDSLDQRVAKDIGMWAGECSMKGSLMSGAFLEGIWEREEERARTLCRYFWETAVNLALKGQSKLTAPDLKLIELSAKEVIESELSQSKTATFDWVNRAMPNLAPFYTDKYEKARQSYRDDFERELTIRTGLAEIEGVKTTPTEIPSSAIIEKDFGFVSDDELRKICKRDYEEIQRVQIAGAHKATIVLCGSLTEALLLDSLQSDEAKARASAKAISKPLTNWDLHDLLDVAIDVGLINAGASVLVKGIKDYRNLIHPGKEVRTKFHVGVEEAAIFRQFLELIIRDLEGNPAKQ